MKTPITYWGGKQQLTQEILRLIPKHKQYDEPFFGGGAVFFSKWPSEVEFINDINGEMINFYRMSIRPIIIVTVAIMQGIRLMTIRVC